MLEKGGTYQRPAFAEVPMLGFLETCSMFVNRFKVTV